MSFIPVQKVNEKESEVDVYELKYKDIKNNIMGEKYDKIPNLIGNYLIAPSILLLVLVFFLFNELINRDLLIFLIIIACLSFVIITKGLPKLFSIRIFPWDKKNFGNFLPLTFISSLTTNKRNEIWLLFKDFQEKKEAALFEMITQDVSIKNIESFIVENKIKLLYENDREMYILCIKENKNDILKLLLRLAFINNQVLDSENHTQKSPIIEAIEDLNINALTILKNETDLNFKKDKFFNKRASSYPLYFLKSLKIKSYNSSYLEYASYCSNKEIVEFLLQDSIIDENTIYFAAINNDIEVIKLLADEYKKKNIEFDWNNILIVGLKIDNVNIIEYCYQKKLATIETVLSKYENNKQYFTKKDFPGFITAKIIKDRIELENSFLDISFNGKKIINKKKL